MCRYAFHTYKAHFACFACRKAFKKTPITDYARQNRLKTGYAAASPSGRFNTQEELARRTAEARVIWQKIEQRYLADVSTCPQCGGQMAAMGLDFKAPPKRNAEAWKIIATLYDNGFAFAGCGCGGPGYVPPTKLRELPAWLAQHRHKAESAKLLDAVKAGR